MIWRMFGFTTRLGWLVVRVVAFATSLYVFFLRPWERSWLATAEESSRPLPGDDLVPAAGIDETRAITIDAPPSAIWPWLVQMGYGRAGWYSYDRIDMRGASADAVNPDWQHLEVGQMVPTHPAGGFKVAALEPERSLVLYMDSATVGARKAAGAGGAEATPAGLKAAGALGSMAMPEFKGTWTFHLEPLGERRTRLLERFRFEAPDQPGSRFARPAMGFGVFLMSRKQMLGLKQRAEHGPTGQAPVTPDPTPA
jgi:hypothetical protein